MFTDLCPYQLVWVSFLHMPFDPGQLLMELNDTIVAPIAVCTGGGQGKEMLFLQMAFQLRQCECPLAQNTVLRNT